MTTSAMATFASPYGYPYGQPLYYTKRSWLDRFRDGPAAVFPTEGLPAVPDGVQIGDVVYDFDEPWRNESNSPDPHEQVMSLGHLDRPVYYDYLDKPDRREWDDAIKGYNKWVKAAQSYEKRRAKRGSAYNRKRDRLEQEADIRERKERGRGYKEYEKAWDAYNKQCSDWRKKGHDTTRNPDAAGAGQYYTTQPGYWGLQQPYTDVYWNRHPATSHTMAIAMHRDNVHTDMTDIALHGRYPTYGPRYGAILM